MSLNGRAAGSPEPRNGSHPFRWIAGAVVLLALLTGAGWFLGRGGPGQTSVTGTAASATAITAPAETRPPADPGSGIALPAGGASPVPTTVLTGLPAGMPRRLPPVALGAVTRFRDGVTAHLVGIKSFNARAFGAGEISGPALAVTVELTNRSGVPISLATAAVNVYAGPQGRRTTTLHDGATEPFAGQLAAGRSNRATYVFSVPLDQRRLVAVTVGTSPTTGTAVFAGPVA